MLLPIGVLKTIIIIVKRHANLFCLFGVVQIVLHCWFESLSGLANLEESDVEFVTTTLAAEIMILLFVRVDLF
jgi:hypothetical protein